MKRSKLEKLVLELSQHCSTTDGCLSCPLCLGGGDFRICALRVSTPANALAGLVMKHTAGKLWIRCKNQSEVAEIRDLLKGCLADPTEQFRLRLAFYVAEESKAMEYPYGRFGIQAYKAMVDRLGVRNVEITLDMNDDDRTKLCIMPDDGSRYGDVSKN